MKLELQCSYLILVNTNLIIYSPHKHAQLQDRDIPLCIKLLLYVFQSIFPILLTPNQVSDQNKHMIASQLNPFDDHDTYHILHREFFIHFHSATKHRNKLDRCCLHIIKLLTVELFLRMFPTTDFKKYMSNIKPSHLGSDAIKHREVKFLTMNCNRMDPTHTTGGCATETSISDLSSVTSF